MVKPKLLGALLMCSGIFTAGLAVADETSACAALFDPDTRDRATDVFVSIARLDENHACFLLPRTVIEKRYREVYSDRMPLMEVLTF